jgi:hypothetical protein
MMHESSKITYSNEQSITARKEIFDSLKEYDATDEETERSLGLFLKSSLLARIFAIQEIYKLILGKPGVILDIGTWRGQTAVLCENLRAIYEPFNLTRRIVAFDTFEGYLGFGANDKPTKIHAEGTYKIESSDYDLFLMNLLQLHEKSNVLGNNFGKHLVVKGDTRSTIPNFFTSHPNNFVSLAFLDVNSFETTKSAIQDVWPKLIPGGYLAIWQLTRDVVPAEGNFYANNFLNEYKHEISYSSLYPGLCLIRKIT